MTKAVIFTHALAGTVTAADIPVKSVESVVTVWFSVVLWADPSRRTVVPEDVAAPELPNVKHPF